MNTLGVALTAGISIALLSLPKRGAIVALLCGLFILPFNEGISVASLHFNTVRLLLLIAFARILIKGEWRGKRFCALDLVVLAHVVVVAGAYVCLRGTVDAAINRLGVSYEAILSYAAFRLLVDEEHLWKAALASIVAICAVIAVGMAYEYAAHANVFAGLGGMADSPAVRNGRPRCQGPFQHAIIAGVFGGTSLPLCMSLWWSRRPRKIAAAIGVASALAIVWASGSSGPAMCVIGVFVGMGVWFVRRYVHLMMLMLGVCLLILHLVMEDPVWALVARGRIFGGSTGYYRYLLIDLFIRNFGDWWLLGTERYIEWNKAYGMGMWDACNMYVRQGLDGGLAGLVLFLTLIAVAFERVQREARVATTTTTWSPIMVWCLGVGVAAHSMAFIGLNYFDGQISAAWYMVLALIASVTSMRRTPKTVEDPVLHVPDSEHGSWQESPWVPSMGNTSRQWQTNSR
jgi:hypothetical protein